MIFNYIPPPLCTWREFNKPDDFFTNSFLKRFWSPVIFLEWNVPDARSPGQESCDVGVIHPQKWHSFLGLQEPCDEFSLQEPHSARAVERVILGRVFLVSYFVPANPKSWTVHVTTYKLRFRLSIYLLQGAVVQENVYVSVVIGMECPRHMRTVLVDPVEAGQSLICKQAVVIAVVSLQIESYKIFVLV